MLLKALFVVKSVPNRISLLQHSVSFMGLMTQALDFDKLQRKKGVYSYDLGGQLW